MIKKSISFSHVTSRLFHLGIGLIFLMPATYSQTIEDYRKRWQFEKNQYAADGQEDAHFFEASFNAYSRTFDDQFTEYLSKPWHDYVISDAIEPEHPKPRGTKPVFKLSDLLTVPPPTSLPFQEQTSGYNSVLKDRLVTPRIRKPEGADFNKGTISFRFYGNEINLSYDKLLFTTEVKTVSEESATAFWQQFCRSNNNHLLDQLMEYRDLLGLNDWGYFNLLKVTAHRLFPNNKWATDLLGWALALHSGFDVRLAYNQLGSTILFPCANTIYSRQFILFNQKRYYLDTELKSSLLATYNNNFSGASQVMDLSFHKSLNFRPSQIERKILFTWNDKRYEFNFRYSPSTLRFYENYPRTDAIIYFDSPVSSQLKEEIYSQFYPIISKMNKAEASSFLLQFVQEAFEYPSVNLQNGADRFLFPEEIFSRKACNDKGRAVLYAWLVRNLVKLPVVALDFQGFYSTAVCFDQQMEGDYYLWKGNKYTFADPTFLHAPIGIMMPALSGLTPKIINLNNNFADSDKKNRIWNLAVGLGASRGGNYRDIILDKYGKSFITGFFEDSKRFTKQTVTHPFIACFSRNNSLQWLRKFEGTGKALGFAIENSNDDEFFIAGSFRGELKMGNNRLQTINNQPDLFFVKFNRNGELMWMKKAGIDSLETNDNLTYLIKFDRSGDNFYTHIANEDDRNVNTGFYRNGDNFIYFTGSRNGTTGMQHPDPKRLVATSNNVPSEIKKEHSQLLAEKCNPSIAGIAAVLNTLAIPGTEIKGSQLQALLNQYNPTFNALNPQLYNAIAQIELIRNENGIISISTVGQKSIVLPEIKLTNNARIVLDQFGNRDISVGIISGVEVGNQGIWTSLNSLLINISSGNLIFDYDPDHTLRTVNFNNSIVKK